MNPGRTIHRIMLLAGGLTALAFLGQTLFADVSLLDQGHIRHQQMKLEKLQKRLRNQAASGNAKMHDQSLVVPLFFGGTGTLELIDNDGMKWFLNTDITFSTTSSASGAMSEASYTHAVAASTLGGGTTSSTLNDAFDGYNSLAISLTGKSGPAGTGSSDYIFYNQNGPAAADPASGGRQIVFPVQTHGTIQMWRKVFVPSNDAFARWLNFVQNTDTSPVSVNVIIANNLGSDELTIITGSSNGDKTADLTDTWVGTMQNFSGTTSSDPREAHILQGLGSVPSPLIMNHFANGNDRPYWAYTLNIPAGQTYCIMNFCVLKPTVAAAAAAAGPLASLTNVNALNFMTADERAQVKNFYPSAQYMLTVKSTAGGKTHPAGSAQYPADSIIKIQATPDTGYHFASWSGDASGISNPLNFQLYKDSLVRANFANAAPIVQITYPADGAIVNGPTTVTVTASDDLAVVKVELYIDGALVGVEATAPYAFDWNTLAESPGQHTIKAVAYDGAGATGSSQITVNVQNITLTMTGSRQVEQAWLIRREYADLNIRVSNPGGAAIQKYILYRKTGSGAYAAVTELSTAQVGTGTTYNDGPLTKGVGYTYKLTAVVGGIEIAASNEVAI